MQLQRTLAAAPSTTRGRALLLSGHGDTLVWTNAKNVLLFNVKTRAVESFNEHTAACTTARFTAGGDHVASGDASGCVRVWNVATKKCVAQVPALSGAVNDVFMDRDLKTLYVCGEGRGRFAGAFKADGSLLGNISGLTRPGNALDVSGDGLRVATGDDAGGCFAHDAAAPFKQRFCVQDQGGRSVNCVRFAPGSSTFCAVGGSKALLYSGDGVAPTALAGHSGSVYCVSFAPGGGQLVTAGADKTVRLYDTNSAREVTTFSAGTALDDTQVGCYWLAADTIASIALNGDVLLFDQRMAACHTRVIAHQRSVTAMAARSATCEELWTADYSGRVLRWSTDEGCLERRPTTHTNQVVGAATCNDELITCGLDDRVVWSGAADARSAALPCAPKSLSVSTGGVAVAATVSGVTLAQDGKVVASVALPGAAVAAISRDGKEVAVGYADGAVRVFSRSPAGELQLHALLARHRDCVTALQFDAAGAMLASCDANREVVVWERCDAVPFWAPKESLGRCVYHTARVTCLAWDSSGKRLATGGLDCNILIWDVAQPASKRETIPAAHRDGVTALAWTGSKLVSAGADACVRVWA